MPTEGEIDRSEDRGHVVPDDQLAPGGWRRVVIGFLLGAVAGAIVALVLPRDDEQHQPVRG